MALTNLEIINQALVFLGQEPLASLTEGKWAPTANALWPAALRETLRAHPWNFASRRAQLNPLAQAPAFGYSAAFQLPTECLRLLEVVDLRDYRIEGRQILAYSSLLNIRFVALVEDCTQFDGLFEAALARNLSAKLAYPVTKSTSLQDAQWQMYAALLQQARNVDGQEEPPPQFDASSLLTVRG